MRRSSEAAVVWFVVLADHPASTEPVTYVDSALNLTAMNEPDGPHPNPDLHSALQRPLRARQPSPRRLTLRAL